MEDLQLRLRYKKSDVDDWTQVEDKALRKKLQNRLAKRKSRTNGTKGKLGKKPVVDKPAQAQSDKANLESDENILPSSVISDDTIDAFTSGSCLNSKGQPPSVDSEISLDSIDEPLFAAFFAAPGLSEHQYIRLTQYSLLRALVLNTRILGLEYRILGDDDALSPWTITNPCPNATPGDLTPTAIQLCTPHHPYLDLLTPPKFRDNVLLTLMGDDQEDQLCYELHLGGFMIWGSQPWNSFGWEVTQAFATNWAWLMDEDLIRSSNFWRGERGEAPLVMPDLGGGILGEVF